MHADDQPFASICERDIDLLLLEELTVTPVFRHWLLRQFDVDPQREATFTGAWHSVSEPGLGESDLEVEIVTTDGTTLRLLIENKIDAPFQDNQLQRYRERGRKALSDDVDAFQTGLIAPDGYLQGIDIADAVDAIMTYEAVQEWFTQRESQRAAFKARMIKHAIKREQRASTVTIDEQVTQFYRYYWTIARREFPHLTMDEPTGVGATNRWIRFKIASLPDDVKLRHKMGNGHVDLVFVGQAANAQAFEEKYRSSLADDMNIEPATSSLFVRINVSAIVINEHPETQADKIRTGLEMADRLLTWYQQVF